MPAQKALLVVDAQAGFFQLNRPLYEGDKVIANIRALIARARLVSTPIIFLQHTGGPTGIFAKGSPGWQIHSAVAPLEDDCVIAKHHADAFFGSPLEQRLHDLSVDTVVVCGFATEGCVDTTVRRAASLEFKIELARDAHSTTDGEVLTARQTVDHHNAVLAIFAEVKKTSEIHFGP